MAGLKSQLQRNREHCMIIANQFKLARGERLELASYILGSEVETFSALGPFELARIVDALEGAKYICTIQTEKRNGERR